MITFNARLLQIIGMLLLVSVLQLSGYTKLIPPSTNNSEPST